MTLRDWLASFEIAVVGMEPTGVHRRLSLYYFLEEESSEEESSAVCSAHCISKVSES